MKELEDYDWFPKLLRQFQMDVIGYFVVLLHLYKPILPKINALVTNKNDVIIDLCSGSAQPAIYVQQHCRAISKTVFTDLFPPNNFRSQLNAHYQLEPLNVLLFTPSASSIYTMYNAFHHFNKMQQQQIISAFKHKKSRFLIAEIVQPNFISFIQVFFAATVGQILICLFLRPLTFKRILFTYIFPINIFTVLIDGIISVCKSSTAKQFSEYLQQYNDDTYCVEIKTENSFFASVTYILGYSKT